MSKSLIYLDIDGVLSGFERHCDISVDKQEWTPWTMKARGIQFNINEDCLHRFRKIQSKTDCSVVISSSWRIGTEPYWLGLKTDLDLEYGIRKIIGRTPYLKEADRLAEIQQWQSQHPQYTNFIILDDSNDFKELEGRRVHTNYQIGLTDEDVEKALLLLADENLRL